MEESKVKQRWKEHFEKLLNQENPREKRKIRTVKKESYVGNIDISMEETRNVLRQMKKGKAQGSYELRHFSGCVDSSRD